MRFGGGAIAGLLLAAPLQAQSTGAEFEPAFSAEDDLDCAIFIGALMAEMEASNTMTPDNRTGLTSALTYFTGRYEAQRGLNITEAFAERYEVYQQRNPAEIQQTCSVRMRAFSVRLQDAGRALSRLQPQAPPPATTQGGEPE